MNSAAELKHALQHNEAIEFARVYALLDRLQQLEDDTKAAGLIDEQGRFVLPTSARFRTKDGVVVKPGDFVYTAGFGSRFFVDDDGTIAVCVSNGDGGWRDMRADECYSTAEAARKGQA